jgi:4-oxalocrotonate tautomerase
MPVVVIKMLRGREPQLKASLIRNVSKSIEKTLGISPDAIRIILEEVPPENFGIGGLSYDLAKGGDDSDKK